MRRSSSSWDLDVPRTDWYADAACYGQGEYWFHRASAGYAMHVCLTHCPVLEQCRVDSEAADPTRRHGTVLAGVWYGDGGQPAQYQPVVHGRCGRCHG